LVVQKHVLPRLGVLVVVMAGMTGCVPEPEQEQVPGLAARGTTMTTVRPARQDLTNRVSLSGKVTLSPVFGLVAPAAGQVRYLNVTPPRSTPTKPTRVASVMVAGKAHHVEVPAGAVFAGRLVDDRSTVTQGMPIVSARHVGYGIVAELNGGQAYQVSDAVGTVQAQIKNGPGPFACTVLGTIAALPEGVIPEPPPQQPAAPAPGTPQVPVRPIGPAAEQVGAPEGSEPTGLRLVCTAPANVRLINGADATLELITAKATNALVLPVEAVAGGQGRGKVDVVLPDRSRQTKDVVLGLTDGKVIEIKSGLTGNEEIAVPGPNLPPAQPQPGDGPGGRGGVPIGK
jgi:hypothetical protein